MGFDRPSQADFTTNQLVSTNVCNFTSETCLFIYSNMVYSANSSDDVLQEIYLSGVLYNSSVSFQNQRPVEYSKKLTNNPGTYKFWLTDESPT